MSGGQPRLFHVPAAIEMIPAEAEERIVIEADRWLPGNETAAHWWLKQQARRYLFHHGAYAVAPEVGVRIAWKQTGIVTVGWEEFGETTRAAFIAKGRACCKLEPQIGIVDVVAIMPRYDALGRPNGEHREGRWAELLTVGVEVKVSRSDFLSGYHETACTMNYVAAPRGMVKPKELPAHVGLLERDPNCYGDMRRRKRPTEYPRPLLGVEAAYRGIAIALSGEWHRRARWELADPFEASEGIGDDD